MLIQPTALEGVMFGRLSIAADPRGAFAKVFGAPEIDALFGGRALRQVNLSRTAIPGTIRGFHFQLPPHAEMKMVVCLAGGVFDVAVDLRAGSFTLRQHVGRRLNPGEFMLLPEGCAHGFQALESDTRLLYLHTAPYVVASESGVRFDDPCLGVHWPLPPVNISARDMGLPRLPESYAGVNCHV